MTQICKDEYVFEVDIEKTLCYYKEQSPCECDFCRNFYGQIKGKFPKLEAFLSEFGIDIARPDELSLPIEIENEGVYSGAAYTVCGKIEKMGMYEIDIQDRQFFSVVVTDGFVAPNRQNGEYFTLSVEGFCLPWELEEPFAQPKENTKFKWFWKNRKNR